MPETNDSTNPVSEPVSEAAAARAKFEQEKMSRRAALRKIGMTSGMALFGMFAVDDLARLALRGLQQHKETQAVAETVAKELRSSGVAFAGDESGGYYKSDNCHTCYTHYDNTINHICQPLADSHDPGYNSCCINAQTAFAACVRAHCGFFGQKRD